MVTKENIHGVPFAVLLILFVYFIYVTVINKKGHHFKSSVKAIIQQNYSKSVVGLSK
jgi:uncharacterized membrane protein YukC